jgi:hypothetical protein
MRLQFVRFRLRSLPHHRRQRNRAQSQFDVTPFLIGGGVMLAGIVGAGIVAPKRWELLEVVNLHNRLTVEPIRWQLGYDPIA